MLFLDRTLTRDEYLALSDEDLCTLLHEEFDLELDLEDDPDEC